MNLMGRDAAACSNDTDLCEQGLKLHVYDV